MGFYKIGDRFVKTGIPPWGIPPDSAYWSPGQIQTDLWLSAENVFFEKKSGQNRIPLWPDQSGTGRFGVQHTSLYQPQKAEPEAYPSLSFAAGKWELLDFTATCAALFQDKSYISLFIAGSAVPGSVAARIFHASVPDNSRMLVTVEHRPNDSAILFGGRRLSTDAFKSYSKAYAGGRFVASAVYGFAEAVLGYGLNGLFSSASFQTPGKTANQPAGRVYAGGDASSTYDFSGDIHEVILIASNTDTAVRQRIEGYLCHKWGVPLCDGHPYLHVRPRR